MPLERGPDQLDLLIGEMLDADELLARFVDGAEELVELGLHRRPVAVLAVLDQEHHQEGDDRRPGVDHQLPRVGIMEHRPGHGPHRDVATAMTKVIG